jgi:hypothetical protein
MTVQRGWSPFAPDYRAELHQALKLAPNMNLPGFRRQNAAPKFSRPQLHPAFTRFVHPELRHLGSFIREWFCVTLQI